MYKISLVLITIVSITACNKSSNSLESKKKELASLKTKLTEIQASIEKLEKEVAKLDTSSKSSKPTEVAVTTVIPQPFSTFIDVQGAIDADQNVSVSTKMPGTITKINVTEGNQVSKGQVLAETDASALQLQIASLQVNLDLATQVFKKQQNLWNQKIGTELQYLQAKSNKENLEKSMNSLYEQVRMTKIISPINGTVDAVNIKLGQSVAPGVPAINVVNFSSLKVKADIAETYSGRVKIGDKVVVYFPDLNDSMVGKIGFSSRAINALTRTFSVEIPLVSDKKYRPNMVAKIRINDFQSVKPEIVIPIKYIQISGNERFVLLAKDNTVVRKQITISREYNGMALVSEGLSEGDELITEGYDLITEGDKIVVANK